MPQQSEFPLEALVIPSSPNDRRTEFIYPYNFVPHGGPRRGRGQEHGMGGDQPFKSWHRWDGLTGRIEYTLTALSPIFVPDPEGTTTYKLSPDNAKQLHSVADFFNVQGRLCLPSTSLKGMIRSVLEAASNSSMGVIEEHRDRFSYRKVSRAGKCGKWTADGKIQRWDMAKLPLGSLRAALTKLGQSTGDEDLHNLCGQPVQVKELWNLHTGIPVVGQFNLEGNWHQAINPPAPATVPLSSGIFQARPMNPRKRMIASGGTRYYCPWDQDIIPLLRGAEGQTVQFKAGTITGLNFPPDRRGNIRNFGNNRVFEIHRGGTLAWSALNPNGYSGLLLPSSSEQKSDQYVRVLYDTAQPPLSVSPQAVIDYRDANPDSPLPEPGNVVYFETDGSGQEVVEFGKAALFKSAEKMSPRQLLQEVSQFEYPTAPDQLCPATRLFGWTPPGSGEAEGEGVAGRVSIGMAWSDQWLQDTSLVPLKILNSPKPQYYPFYLRPASGQEPSSKVAYYTKDSGEPWAQESGTPRGRKFYLHHPAALSADAAAVDYVKRGEAEITQEGRAREPTCPHSPQNSTCAVLPAGAIFRGFIEFDSLDPYELGLLLWSLTFSNTPSQDSQKHAHKVGMGKGIGMGSVRFHLEQVVINEMEKSWVDLSQPATDPDLEDNNERSADAAEQEGMVRRFKNWMVSGKDEDAPIVSPQTSGSTDTDMDAALERFNQRFSSQPAALTGDIPLPYDEHPFVRELLAIARLDLVPPDILIQYYPPYWSDDWRPDRKSIRQWHADEGYTYFVHQRQKRPYTNQREEPLATPTAIEQGYRQGMTQP